MEMLDLVLLLQRVALGGFFLLARFRFVYDPSRLKQPWFNPDRHQSLVNKVVCHCGYGGGWYMAAFVACAELAGGAAVLFGFLTELAAFGLMLITIFATMCTAREKVMEQNPVDCFDVVCCYLWRVEGLYIVFAASIAALGGGLISVDALIW